MSYFIQSSHPNKMTEYWDEPDINDLFTDNDSSKSGKITTYLFLKESDGIGWDWSHVRKDRLKKGDTIFIYFSGRGFGRICCLTKIQNIKYVIDRERPLVAYLKKIKWFEDEISKRLSYKKLKEYGLKTNLQILTDITDNNQLVNYIKSVVDFDNF